MNIPQPTSAANFANLNPNNDFSFEHMFSRSYTGNVIASISSHFRTASAVDLALKTDELSVNSEFLDSTSATSDIISDSTPGDDYDILKHTMAAILYVEAKQAAVTARGTSDSVENDLTSATTEDIYLYRQKLDELLDEFGDRFDENDTTPSNMPPVDIKFKEEFKNKTFYTPERREPLFFKKFFMTMAE